MEIILFLLVAGFIVLFAIIFSIPWFWWTLAIILLFLFVLAAPYLGYYRLKLRNRILAEVAKEYNLTFQEILPSYSKYWFLSNFKNIQLNVLEGNIKGHSVLIKDLIYSGITNLFLRGRHQTIIMVDNQKVKGRLPSPTLGGYIAFATVAELKQLLRSLGEVSSENFQRESTNLDKKISHYSFKTILLIITGVILLVFLIWSTSSLLQKFVSRQTPTQQLQKSSTPTTSTAQNQSYKGTDFGLVYPKNWVIQNHGCSGIGGTDCTNLAPTTAIAYYKQKYGNDSLSLSGFSAHKTNQNPRDWLGMIISGGSFTEDKEITVNGYPAAFIKSVVPNTYTDYYYAVANKGTVIYFNFRSYSEGHPYGQSVQIDDYSQYLTDFQTIVYSIKFD